VLVNFRVAVGLVPRTASTSLPFEDSDLDLVNISIKPAGRNIVAGQASLRMHSSISHFDSK
jgi:hypothetical protein